MLVHYKSTHCQVCPASVSSNGEVVRAIAISPTSSASLFLLTETEKEMSKKYTGHCACGQVTYGFDTEPALTANCHCTDCKRASGAEMTTWVVIPDTDFTVLSGSTKSFSYGPNTETCADRGSIASSVPTAVPGWSPTT